MNPQPVQLMRDEQEYGAAAAEMIEIDLRRRGIGSLPVLRAMRQLPRHVFVDRPFQAEAYADKALPTRDGQTISQPFIVATMTELLDVDETHTVLEIGTGSGYQTMLLAMLAKHVVSVERHGELSESARRTLASFGIDNVTLIVGDGSKGAPGGDLYDRILVTAGAPAVPESLTAQLQPDGIMVIPIGDRTAQTLMRVQQRDGQWKSEPILSCRFVPLVGTEGWSYETND